MQNRLSDWRGIIGSVGITVVSIFLTQVRDNNDSRARLATYLLKKLRFTYWSAVGDDKAVRLLSHHTQNLHQLTLCLVIWRSLLWLTNLGDIGRQSLDKGCWWLQYSWALCWWFWAGRGFVHVYSFGMWSKFAHYLVVDPHLGWTCLETLGNQNYHLREPRRITPNLDAPSFWRPTAHLHEVWWWNLGK